MTDKEIKILIDCLITIPSGLAATLFYSICVVMFIVNHEEVKETLGIKLKYIIILALITFIALIIGVTNFLERISQ